MWRSSGCINIMSCTLCLMHERMFSHQGCINQYILLFYRRDVSISVMHMYACTYIFMYLSTWQPYYLYALQLAQMYLHVRYRYRHIYIYMRMMGLLDIEPGSEHYDWNSCFRSKKTSKSISAHSRYHNARTNFFVKFFNSSLNCRAGCTCKKSVISKEFFSSMLVGKAENVLEDALGEQLSTEPSYYQTQAYKKNSLIRNIFSKMSKLLNRLEISEIKRRKQNPEKIRNFLLINAFSFSLSFRTTPRQFFHSRQKGVKLGNFDIEKKVDIAIMVILCAQCKRGGNLAKLKIEPTQSNILWSYFYKVWILVLDSVLALQAQKRKETKGLRIPHGYFVYLQNLNFRLHFNTKCVSFTCMP